MSTVSRQASGEGHREGGEIWPRPPCGLLEKLGYCDCLAAWLTARQPEKTGPVYCGPLHSLRKPTEKTGLVYCAPLDLSLIHISEPTRQP